MRKWCSSGPVGGFESLATAAQKGGKVMMRGFILTGKVKDVVAVLAALAQLEQEFPQFPVMALLDCQAIKLS